MWDISYHQVEPNTTSMIHFKIIVSCVFFMGLAGASGDAETELLSVFEGRNLTIFTTSVSSDEDPQVMFSLLNGGSEDLIAQLFCYNQICEHDPSDPAVFIHYQQHNVTVGFVNAGRSLTGRYGVTVHSKQRSENRIYNITVIAPPSSMHSKQVAAGIGAGVTVAIIILIIAAGVMGVRYYRKGFTPVPVDGT